jgi:large subunit ribosomal protein L36e
MNKGYPTTVIEKTVKPSHRKGITSAKTSFVRSVIREVAGFAPYERRVMELLRNSKVRAHALASCVPPPLTRLPRPPGQKGTEADEEARAYLVLAAPC